MPKASSPRVFVHRWTADELTRHLADAEGFDAASRAPSAARYWTWRVRAWPQDRLAEIHDLIETRHHLLAAGDRESAADISEAVFTSLDQRGAWDQAAALIRDTLTWLPADSERRGRSSPFSANWLNSAATTGRPTSCTPSLQTAKCWPPPPPTTPPSNAICQSPMASLRIWPWRPGRRAGSRCMRSPWPSTRALAAAFPANPITGGTCRSATARLADLAREIGQVEQARCSARQALTVRQALVARHRRPRHQRDLRSHTASWRTWRWTPGRSTGRGLLDRL